jgi:hypothetical protein
MTAAASNPRAQRLVLNISVQKKKKPRLWHRTFKMCPKHFVMPKSKNVVGPCQKNNNLEELLMVKTGNFQ